MPRMSQLYEKARLTDWAWKEGVLLLASGTTPQMCNYAGREKRDMVELCHMAGSEDAGPPRVPPADNCSLVDQDESSAWVADCPSTLIAA